MEVFSQVASNLARNKLRSFLTMAGIAWGVASIVLINICQCIDRHRDTLSNYSTIYDITA